TPSAFSAPSAVCPAWTRGCWTLLLFAALFVVVLVAFVALRLGLDALALEVRAGVVADGQVGVLGALVEVVRELVPVRRGVEHSVEAGVGVDAADEMAADAVDVVEQRALEHLLANLLEEAA